jgi:hypothetical protein
MSDNLTESSYRSRHGIQKLRNHTYHTWSFQCRMLLSEAKVRNVVNGNYPRPKAVGGHSVEEQATLTAAAKKQIQKDIEEWDDYNEEALRIISFTVSDQLQGPIRYGKTAKRRLG